MTGAGAFSDFAMRTFLRRRGIDPDKDVTPARHRRQRVAGRCVGERSLVAAAPFAPEDTVRLMRLGFPMIANLGDSLNIPQGVIADAERRSGEVSGNDEAVLEGFDPMVCNFTKTNNEAEAIKAKGYESGLQGGSRRSSIMPMICMRRRCPPIWLLMCRGCSSCWTRTNAAVWSIASLHSIGSSTIGP